MSKPRVLYVCHNHPSARPGGAELYAMELYEGMRENHEFEPIFLAKGGPPMSQIRPHPGTVIGLVDGDPHQYYVHPQCFNHDLLYGTINDKEFYTHHIDEFLRAFRPDVVHFQHTLFLGYDIIRQVRNTLGDVPIVYTLHEYWPICHRQGQMVRTVNNEELCDRESPQRCHECFPNTSPQVFFMRKKFIQSHFSLVDLFLAPSRFLRQRFIEWGVPAQKIRFEEYGRRSLAPSLSPAKTRPRNRFGYFGQLNPYKGIDVLLKAMKVLAEGSPTDSVVHKTLRSMNGAPVNNGIPREADERLWVHGANLDLQIGAFQKKIHSLLDATRHSVTMVGPYRHDELPRLMENIDWVVVPSTWWENSPLVIQEAFAYGKPIICSDIGGLAEKIAHGVNGLHFRAGDPVHLAETIREAAHTPGLWDKLREGIRSPYPMKDHVEAVTGLYRELLERKAAVRN